MMTRNLAFAVLSALTLIMTSSALAEQPGDFRPGPRRPSHWRCERAQERLRKAEKDFEFCAWQLQVAPQYCGGAPACIYTAQVHYNNALNSLQAAQREYNRACF